MADHGDQRKLGLENPRNGPAQPVKVDISVTFVPQKWRQRIQARAIIDNGQHFIWQTSPVFYHVASCITAPDHTQ
ncbi:hypothetical protein [Devosia sp.]